MTQTAKPEQTGVNESGAKPEADTGLTQPRSRPVRYRLILPSGQPSPAFKPKPGELGKLLAATARPGQVDFEVVEAN